MRFIAAILIILFTTSGFSQDSKNVLIFTKTAGYRHQSIEKGVELIQNLGKTHTFNTQHSEDASLFTKRGLATYDLVIFLSTTGDILNEEQQLAFKHFIQNGGSFMGIHAAADTEYDWPWYGKLVGAYFESHPNNPNVRTAMLQLKDKHHPSCKHLNANWQRDDEWYNYKNINPNIKVLLNLDESSYAGGTNGKNHPIAWYHEFDGGKAFYTGGGHTEASFEEEAFIQHLLGGILYCLN